MAATKKSKQKKEAAKERKALLAMVQDVFDEDDPKDREKIGRDHYGRPTVMTKQTIQKLETAFKFGCSDREACIFAEISPSTMYAWIKDHPEFSERKEELKEAPVIAARAVVYQSIAIKENTADAWAMLRSKRKEEFAEQKNLVVSKNVVTVEELERAAKYGVEFEEDAEDEEIEAEA